MNVSALDWTPEGGWRRVRGPARLADPHLMLVFGAPEVLERPEVLGGLRSVAGGAPVVGCSTAGEIHGTRVREGTVTATAVRFAHSRVDTHLLGLDADCRGCAPAGALLARTLDPEGLRHVLVLSDGLAVNGSELVRGMAEVLPQEVTVSGGLAGDGERFGRTLVVHDGIARSRGVVAVALYGQRLAVGIGSMGGWDPFGPDRLITRSEGNVLHELDGRSALTLYRSYLGEHAAQLPSSGLLFPLAVLTQGGDRVVRTLLAVDEDADTMTFAGDVPTGSHARLMHASFDRLVDGAIGAARAGRAAPGARSPALAILISCVGRRLVLGQRVEEEVEGVQEVLGARTVLTGFYSYGEIAPMTAGSRCELHNQTMTVTTLAET